MGLDANVGLMMIVCAPERDWETGHSSLFVESVVRRFKRARCAARANIDGELLPLCAYIFRDDSFVAKWLILCYGQRSMKTPYALSASKKNEAKSV